MIFKLVITNASWRILLPTSSGENNLDVSEINNVSKGLLLFSLANPGVSVSGGKANVTFNP